MSLNSNNKNDFVHCILSLLICGCYFRFSVFKCTNVCQTIYWIEQSNRSEKKKRKKPYAGISTNNRLSVESSGRMFALTLFLAGEENMDERAGDAHPFCSTSGWIKVSCTYTVHPFEWHAMYYISLSLRHIVERGTRENRKNIMRGKMNIEICPTILYVCNKQFHQFFPVCIVFGLYANGNVERQTPM